MRKEAEIYALVRQDNSRPHTSAATTDAIACLGFIVLPHPDYSQSLALSDFHLFHKLKNDLRGQTLNSESEVKVQCTSVFGDSKRIFKVWNSKTC
jgi:hypothetical protein